MNNFESLIGYKFNNPYYLERALTHSSYNREKNTKHEDNERLEFLGDAFFDAIVSGIILLISLYDSSLLVYRNG